jgi:hypothetical protein
LCSSSQVDGAGRGQWVKFNHAKTSWFLENPLEIIMKIRKNFEGLFLVAAAVGIFASYASAETVVAQAPAPAPHIATVSKAAVAAPAIPTVMVVGHRLTAAEKARLG